MEQKQMIPLNKFKVFGIFAILLLNSCSSYVKLDQSVYTREIQSSDGMNNISVEYSVSYDLNGVLGEEKEESLSIDVNFDSISKMKAFSQVVVSGELVFLSRSKHMLPKKSDVEVEIVNLGKNKKKSRFKLVYLSEVTGTSEEFYIVLK